MEKLACDDRYGGNHFGEARTCRFAPQDTATKDVTDCQPTGFTHVGKEACWRLELQELLELLAYADLCRLIGCSLGPQADLQGRIAAVE